MNIVFWTGYCNNERTEAIRGIQDIVSSFGDITDFKQFSDFSLSVKIELKEKNMDELFLALDDYMSMDSAGKIISESDRERVVFLNVSFIKGTGYLKDDIPAIPG